MGFHLTLCPTVMSGKSEYRTGRMTILQAELRPFVSGRAQHSGLAVGLAVVWQRLAARRKVKPATPGFDQCILFGEADVR